jgi:hypothetical protein
MEILRQKIKADKKLVVAQNLNLTDAEGTAFWPVYDAYQKDLQQINQRLAATIEAYATAYNAGPITNETAKKLSDETAAIDDAEAKLKTASSPRSVAPPRRKPLDTSRSRTRSGRPFATSSLRTFRWSPSDRARPGGGRL